MEVRIRYIVVDANLESDSDDAVEDIGEAWAAFTRHLVNLARLRRTWSAMGNYLQIISQRRIE